MSWALIGIGNPGPRYDGTRHNVGFDFIDAIALLTGAPRFKKKLRLHSYASEVVLSGGVELLLLKPLTYVNNTGEILPALKKKGINASSLIIAVDNIELPPGVVRLKKGAKGSTHNGLRSIVRYSSSPDFYTLYIGVGAPRPGEELIAHVLGRPRPEDRILIKKRIEEAALCLTEKPLEDFTALQNTLNARH